MPTLVFSSLNEARKASRCEFSDWLYKEHHYVKVKTGWVRTFGPPKGCRQTQARVWHKESGVKEEC